MPKTASYTYDRLFRSRRVPRGTWVFTDFDRLGAWELELAARAYRSLKAAGLTVLNDPAIVCQRFTLLRRLREQGFNRFAVWSVDAGEWPDRYPVFLRAQSAHRGSFSGLLGDRAALEAAIAERIGRGVPRRELMVVEYCAEAVREGLFRKLASYRVGAVMVPALCVHQSSWVAKDGEMGIAGQDLYDDEYRIVAEDRHCAEIRPAFEIGEIEFGRADFGMVDGRPQVYEINTNPTIGILEKHPFAVRIKADRLFQEKFAAALRRIDTPDSAERVPIKSSVLKEQRRHDRWMTKGRWVI
ncbi:hypothetical protein [Dongia deserti]|uniref:hypothetical protein n=1 Tax=Dongia deserti TaxID=2268030 RepID=UPI0013C47084|nr:hypothetical protein [Dongia deserti]